MNAIRLSTRRRSPRAVSRTVWPAIFVAVLLSLSPQMAKAQAALPSESDRAAGALATCQSNLRQLGLAFLVYAGAHDNHLPNADRWMEDIAPYVGSDILYRCPAAPAGEKWSYAYNRDLSDASLMRIADPAKTVLLFESSLNTRDASDTGQSLVNPPRHGDSTPYVMCDGREVTYPNGQQPPIPVTLLNVQPPAPGHTAKADIDPLAMALVRKSVGAYQALHAYSGVQEIHATGRGGIVATVDWQLPGKFRYSLTHTSPDGASIHSVVASDGKNYWTQPADDPKHYFRLPVDDSGGVNAAIEVGLMQFPAPNVLGMPPWAFTSLIHPNPNPHLPQLVSLKSSGAGTWEGIPVNELTETLVSTDETRQFTQTNTFFLGQTDHLIRRLVLESKRTDAGAPPNAETFRLEEDVRSIHTASTLPAATFHYTPSAGVTLGTPKQWADLETERNTYWDKRLVVGSRPFPFTATTLDGTTVSPAQYQGKVLLLDFWATWCGPCVGEMPNVIATYNKHHADGLEVLGVSLDTTRSDLDGFLRDNKVPYPQIFDGKGWKGALPTMYNVRAIPFSLLIGRDGRIAAVDERGADLETAVAKALAAN